MPGPSAPPAITPGPAPPKPSATDGVKNGTETDVDCGGSDKATPRCSLYKTCVASSDCAVGTCVADAAGGVGRCQLAPSCTGADGTRTCGLTADEDCCTSLPLPEATYSRWTDTAYVPTFVSAFRLDRYEVTVGRLRAYFTAVAGNPQQHAPAPGAGAHPKIANSGWRSSFDVRLPASWTEINDRLTAAGCAVGGNNADGGSTPWTALPGPYEELPITCIDWYTLFAFCEWDGGRLPTDAEWLYAAGGGDELRNYAWSTAPNDVLPTWQAGKDLVATGLFDPVDQATKLTVGTPYRTTDPVTGSVNDGPVHMSPPGRKTGYGRWGHADLTGNVLEYLLDSSPVDVPCAADCARVDWPDPPQDQPGAYPPAWWTGPADAPIYPDGTRTMRGGAWDGVHPLITSYAYTYTIFRTYSYAGGRCARDVAP